MTASRRAGPAATRQHGAVTDGMGPRFARALAAKDTTGLRQVLAPDVDFRGLTPGRAWEASSADELVDEIMLGAWFDEKDEVQELEDVQVGAVVDRQRVSYRLRVANPDGVFLVEQQAYFDVEGDRITWLRVICSGFRPVDGPAAGT